jgi:hypothetical protein
MSTDSSADDKPGPFFTLRELRMAIARRRVAEQSVDGRPSVSAMGNHDADPLLEALKREHAKEEK